MKHVYLITFLIGSFVLRSQSLNRAVSYTGNGDKRGKATALSGNAQFVTGEFTGTMTVPGSPDTTLSSAGGKDIFITQHSGTSTWAISLGSSNDDAATSIVSDQDGNLLVSGYYSGVVDFDPGPGTSTLSAGPGVNAFVAKFDPNGLLIWSRSFGGTGIHRANDLDVDLAGNVYVCGSMQGNGDYDPGAGTFSLIMTGGNTDGFVCKIDKDGNFIWAQRFGGSSGATISADAIEVEASQHVCLTGSFNGTVDFDPSAGSYNIGSSGLGDVFMMRLRSSGSLHWANTAGSSGLSFGKDVVLSAKGIVFTGLFNGNVDFDPGVPLNEIYGWNDLFVITVDTLGSVVWLRTSNNQNYTEPHAITAGAGYLYLTGEYAGNADFDFDSLSSVNKTAVGMNDVFFLQLTDDGDFYSVASMGGAGDDAGLGITWVPFAEVLITGSYARVFTGDSDFDPGSGVYNLNSLSNASEVFVTQLYCLNAAPDGISETQSVRKIICFPNPSSDRFEISGVERDEILDVFNLSGERVGTFELTPQRRGINLSELQTGMYFLKMRSSGAGTRVIKQ